MISMGKGRDQTWELCELAKEKTRHPPGEEGCQVILLIVYKLKWHSLETQRLRA